MKKILVIIIFVLIIILSISGFKTKNNLKENGKNQNIAQVENKKENEIIKENVSGYHWITYNQAAKENSLIGELKVTATETANIGFAIGKIDKKGFLKDRIYFELKCEKGENKFDLQSKRYLIKKDEYLFMDLNGQDVLYKKDGANKISLVQDEKNETFGKIPFTESDYALPFKYSLNKLKNYNVLYFGNDITKSDSNKGLNATDAEHDYYYLTNSRLEKIFENTEINFVKANEWEKGFDGTTRQEWLNNNLKQSMIENLDLLILQIGENFKKEDNAEEIIKEFCDYIRAKSPNVEIIFIGTWNADKKVVKEIPLICDKLDLEYVNINDLYTDDYKSLINESETEEFQKIYYPNNEAMQIISNRIIEILGLDNYEL